MAERKAKIIKKATLEDKRALNPKADDMNLLAEKPNGTQYLACGSRKSGNRSRCLQIAGFGTPHVGSGRCKFHGGLSTGPKTAEGKAKAAKNSTIHGLYAQLFDERGQEIFNALIAEKDEATNLTMEIMAQKTRIIRYLDKYKEKWDKIAAKHGPDEADKQTRVFFTSGKEGGLRSYYHAGTIEDKALDRALNTLGRLIEKQARLTDDNNVDDLIGNINAELRAATRGQISVSWGGAAQSRGGAANG